MYTYSKNMKITYGIKDNNIDVTNICMQKLKRNNIIIIPRSDNIRIRYFSDPTPDIKKLIFIENNQITLEYDDLVQVEINTTNNIITTITDDDINNKIDIIHKKLKINHGSLNDELPEQKMVVRYLKGDEKVLEIGGNIGRNSLVIASILKNNNNFVTLESDINIAIQLHENKNLNYFNFYVHNSALSNRKLIQRDWITIPSETLLEGYNWINTIRLEKLKKLYKINFDTLVLDCEGAFYYILMDMPEILNNINLIIMENDYENISHKNYIDDILIKNNFSVNYVESGGWGVCYDNFFEVWIKSDI